MYIENISYHSDKKKLSGRSFSCLHEKTQEGFAGILSELELDSPLAYFIDNYSVLREEQLELEWMKKIQFFLEEKLEKTQKNP